MSRVPRGESPSIDHLFEIMHNTEISNFVIGHLMIEGLLVQFLEKQGATYDELSKSNFPSKVRSCQEHKLFDSRFADFLLEINAQRNRFAHKLGHRMTLEEAFHLAGRAAASGVDFSDDAIHQDVDFARGSYSVDEIVWEIFSNTTQDLAFMMDDRGVPYSMG